MTMVALGSNHFIAEYLRIDDKSVAQVKTMITYLENASGHNTSTYTNNYQLDLASLII